MRRLSIAAEPWAIAVLLACAYLVIQPLTADFAAQVYRTELFEREGFTLWNGAWYGGHHTPGYSVLFPPLASLLGVRTVGALAAVASAFFFQRLTRERFGEDAWVGALWFGAATATNLFTGRLTFSLGVALALAALLAAQRGHLRWATTLGALCPLASPVAGLFLALAGIAYALAYREDSRWKTGAWIAASGLIPAMMMAVLFPEGGTEPFVTSAFWPVLAFAAVVFVFVPTENRAFRVGVLLYALACTAAYLIDTPMGGNATRLGAMFGGPVLACVLWPHKKWVLAAVALPLLFWQWSPPVRDLWKADGDPSLHTAYFAPLHDFLESRGPLAGRIEVVPTVNKWESAHVAPFYPLARGWERQLDLKYNHVFYGGALTKSAYRKWLDDAGVHYVALPDVRLDYAAKKEARLVLSQPDYLQPVWSNEHWRVYAVKDPAPLVDGPARLTRLGTESFALNSTGPGRVNVRVRYTPYWALSAGVGCVQEGPNGQTQLDLEQAGPVRVVARFAPGRVISDGPRCRRAT